MRMYWEHVIIFYIYTFISNKLEVHVTLYCMMVPCAIFVFVQK